MFAVFITGFCLRQRECGPNNRHQSLDLLLLSYLCRSLYSEGEKTTKNIQPSIFPCFSPSVCLFFGLFALLFLVSRTFFSILVRLSQLDLYASQPFLTLTPKNIKNNTLIVNRYRTEIYSLCWTPKAVHNLCSHHISALSFRSSAQFRLALPPTST